MTNPLQDHFTINFSMIDDGMVPPLGNLMWEAFNTFTEERQALYEIRGEAFDHAIICTENITAYCRKYNVALPEELKKEDPVKNVIFRLWLEPQDTKARELDLSRLPKDLRDVCEYQDKAEKLRKQSLAAMSALQDMKADLEAGISPAIARPRTDEMIARGWDLVNELLGDYVQSHGIMHPDNTGVGRREAARFKEIALGKTDRILETLDPNSSDKTSLRVSQAKMLNRKLRLSTRAKATKIFNQACIEKLHRDGKRVKKDKIRVPEQAKKQMQDHMVQQSLDDERKHLECDPGVTLEDAIYLAMQDTELAEVLARSLLDQ